MLPDDVRKAVAAMDKCNAGCTYEQCDACVSWQNIRAHLRAREVEVERHVKMLADCFRMAGADPDGNEDWRIAPDALRAVTDLRRDYDEVLDWQARAERAEALLREALPYCDTFPDLLRDGGDELRDRITAHLSENSRG